MIDKFFYNFFSTIDSIVSWVETRLINLSTWCWHKRLSLLNKRRRKKK